jgi:hypothetical protein
VAAALRKYVDPKRFVIAAAGDFQKEAAANGKTPEAETKKK